MRLPGLSHLAEVEKALRQQIERMANRKRRTGKKFWSRLANPLDDGLGDSIDRYSRAHAELRIPFILLAININSSWRIERLEECRS